METFSTKNRTWGWNRSWLRTERGWNRSILRTERGNGNVLWLRTEREGWNRSLNKNAKNGTEREGRSSTQNGTERNENGTIKKKERERNDQAEAPRSRTERNDFKKVGTCPALAVTGNQGAVRREQVSPGSILELVIQTPPDFSVISGKQKIPSSWIFLISSSPGVIGLYWSSVHSWPSGDLGHIVILNTGLLQVFLVDL